MSHNESHAHSHDAQHHGHGGNGKYWAVFVALCVLTTASFFTYSDAWPFKDTPSVGWAFMMAVSCTKALLVMLFFMHLLWEANWKYVLTIPAALMSVFMVLMLVPDVGRRAYYYSQERTLHAAEESPHHGDHDEDHGHENVDHSHDNH